MITDTTKTKRSNGTNTVLTAGAVKLRLTPKQNAILFCLQNGCCLITSSQYKQVWCAGNKGQFEFSNGLFWRLVKMGLIYQGSWEEHRYNYVLTELGKKVKTRKVDTEAMI